MRLLTCLLAVSACAAPDVGDFYTTVDVSTGGRADAALAVADLAASAEDSLHVALPAGVDTEVTDPLVAAWDDGLDVEVVTDTDQREDAGIVDLVDAGIPVTFSNDGIDYFEFSINADVSWTSNDTTLSTSFVVADRLRFVAASDLGWDHDGMRVIIQGQGEDLADDLLKEHNQLHGYAGQSSDSVSETAYSNTAKSIADPRWMYPLGTGSIMEVWFGPQERVTKRIIDAVYSAKSDVRVLTDDLANEGLVKALQDKAELDFDVEVTVGPAFGTSTSALSRLLEREADDVDKRRVETGRNPTIVLVDFGVARDGNTYPAKAFVLSHDLYSAERLFRGSEVITDQLIDGVLYVFEDPQHAGDPDSWLPELRTLHDAYEAHAAMAKGGL